MKPTNDVKRECLGNFCILEYPDCANCQIDDALDDLEFIINAREFVKTLAVEKITEV